MSTFNGYFARPALFQNEPVLSASQFYQSASVTRWVNSTVAPEADKAFACCAEQVEKQFWHDPTNELIIRADARLDNRSDIFVALSLAQNKLLTDSQLILLAWQKWGRNCPHYLVGDFAFVIRDTQKKVIFCARDHIGASPFFYCLTPQLFAFANDMQTILATPTVSGQLDEEYIAASLQDKFFCQPDRTYFSNIRKLPPGHSLTIETYTETLERYWFPTNLPDVRYKNDAKYAEAAQEIYIQAVRDRLCTTRPVGVHLSGGLDSSSLAVLTAREQRRQGKSPPAIFTWQPKPTPETSTSWEYAYLRAICKQENLVVQYCPITVEDSLEILKQNPVTEPITNVLLVETTTQRKAALQGVRLLLSGWGGDEGLSSHGNGFQQELLSRGQWKKLYRSIQFTRQQPWKVMTRELFSWLFPHQISVLNKMRRRPFAENPSGKPYVHPDFILTGKNQRTTEKRLSSIRASLIQSWTNGTLTERMESWHASGARHGIVYAYPLLDRRLLEFVAGLPPEQFVRGKWKRWIMRTAMKGVLPDEIRWQQKESDFVRAGQALSVARQALGIVGQQMANAPSLPSRSRYLDMPRLLEQLRPESLAENQRLGDLLHAVQFLDF